MHSMDRSLIFKVSRAGAVRRGAVCRLVTAWFGLLLLSMTFSLSANDFSVDMRDTDIKEFIATIGKLTNKTIIIDQRVKGKINIRSPRSVSSNELYQIFLVQLGVSGFAVVDLGNDILKVIPSQGAKLEGIEVQTDNNPLPAISEQVITRVVQVNNVDVNALVPILRPLVDNKTGIIAPYPASNVILITDRESNVRRLLKIIIQVDKADTDDTEIIKLFNASASEIAQTLTTLVREQAKGAEGARKLPRISADERTNSLIIRADKAARVYLKRIITKLDNEVSTDTNTRVHYLKYAKAADLVTVLESISSSIIDANKTSAGKATTQAPSNINIKAHESTNSIVMSGSPRLIKDLTQVINKLDIRRAQVLVEAIIVEMSDSRLKELGVDWLMGNASSSGSIPFININNTSRLANAADASTPLEAIGSVVANQGASLGFGKLTGEGFNFAALLNALQSDTNSNVLSTPSLMTMDNEEASILVGEEIPVITGNTVGDNNTNPFQTITRQDVGIKLKVTPQVNDGSAVQLKIQQEVSSVSSSTVEGFITKKREINTSVLVDDGSTIVLGGLIDDAVDESSSKVPWLGDIPVLGKLFSSESTTVSRRNLMIFLRPTIIRDQKTMADVSSNKYGYIRTQQLMLQEQGVALFDETNLRVLPEWTGMGPSMSNIVPPPHLSDIDQPSTPEPAAQ